MDNKRIIDDLLRAHGLRKTALRVEILNLFMEHNFALSASDISAKMTPRPHRVTIYRTLNSFEAHGIFYRVLDVQGIKYAMCNSYCSDKPHTDKHAHFVCDECHKTYCLKDVEIPQIEISQEFSVSRVNYTLNGLCKECRC